MMRRFVALAAALLLVVLAVLAQSPAPVIMQAAPDVTPGPAAAAPANEAEEADLIAEIQLLQELKAKNADTLKKQQTLLESLDQLQKDADQIRIFAKRG